MIQKGIVVRAFAKNPYLFLCNVSAFLIASSPEPLRQSKYAVNLYANLRLVLKHIDIK